MSISTPPYAVIDCETTGIGKHDRIVEVAVVTLDPQTWELIDEYDTLINPERDVGPSSIHGITASMVEAAPIFPEVAVALSRRLHGSVLIAHNLPFDTRILGYEFKRIGANFDPGLGMCTLQATREKLSAACQRYGILLNLQHSALADARATAALAQEVLPNNELTPQPVVLGHISQTFNARTLRRESSNIGINEFVRVVSLARYPYADDVLLQYLEALNWVLDDRYIDNEEHAAILELASALSISDQQRRQAHRSYLLSIIAAAERDGIVTDAEQKFVAQIAKNLDVNDVPIPQVTQLPTASNLCNGMRVCFTGKAIVSGKPMPRSSLEETAALIGLQPVRGVTKKGCDLLVAADPSSRSGKARKARDYGIPVIGVADFLNEVHKGT